MSFSIIEPYLPYIVATIIFAIILRLLGTHVHEFSNAILEEIKAVATADVNIKSVNLIGVILIFILIVFLFVHGSIEFVFGTVKAEPHDGVPDNLLYAALVLGFGIILVISMKLSKSEE